MNILKYKPIILPDTFCASERIAVMKYTGVTSRNNFLETYEHDIDTPEKLINIIERTILPRLWF